MTTARIAELLHARPYAVGWMAHCPGPLHAHGDRKPSLSIREGRDGRTLLCCFTGCATEDIVKAAGLRMGDLFVEPSSKPRETMPLEVRDVLSNLSGRLTKRERVLEKTIITTNREQVDAAIARALAMAVEGEIVQVALLQERP